MSHDSEDGDRPTAAHVARSMTGNTRTPKWLVEGLGLAAGGIAQVRITEATARRSKELKEKLESVSKMAAGLKAALIDAEVLSYLERGGSLHFDHGDPNERSTAGVDAPWLLELLKRIQARSAEQAASVQVRKRKAPVGPNPEGLTAREVCALVVIEAWQALHRKKPPIRSERIAEISDKLWQAAGGSLWGKSDDPQARWRTSLARANNYTGEHRGLVSGYFDSMAPKLWG